MFELKDVRVDVDGGTILHETSLVLNERRIGIIGPNGSGKSTLVRLLNGLHLPSSGTVLVDGMDTRKKGDAIRRKVGFVFQNPDHQIVMPTVGEDLAFGLENIGWSRERIKARSEEILSMYGLADHADSPAYLLSGGEKKLLTLLSVLAMEPECIILDEPLTYLDLRNRNRFSEVLHALDHRLIVISHDLDLLQGFDRVILMDEGRIVMDDIPAAVTRHYSSAYAA